MLAGGFRASDGRFLCELRRPRRLDGLAPENLAEVFSWYSFDRDFRYRNEFRLPDPLVLAKRRIEDVERAVLGEEHAEGLVISEGHNPNFYGPARAWSLGATMAEIGEAIELSEGDLVLTFNKTIDLMRQVREMLTDVAPDRPLRSRLAEAEKLLKRGIVEQSLTLGFAPIELPDLPPLEPDPAPDPEPAANPARRTRRARPAPAADASSPLPHGPEEQPGTTPSEPVETVGRARRLRKTPAGASPHQARSPPNPTPQRQRPKPHRRSRAGGEPWSARRPIPRRPAQARSAPGPPSRAVGARMSQHPGPVRLEPTRAVSTDRRPLDPRCRRSNGASAAGAVARAPGRPDGYEAGRAGGARRPAAPRPGRGTTRCPRRRFPG
jgi:hypothetical protein